MPAFNLYCTEEEKASWKRVARARHYAAVSDWIRVTLAGAAGMNPPKLRRRKLGKMAAERAAAAVRRKNRKYSPPVREFLRRGRRK